MPTLTFYLVPYRGDPNETIQYECGGCGEEMTVHETGDHALGKHFAGTYTITTDPKQ